MHALLDWAATVRCASGVIDVHLAEDLEEPGVYSLASGWRDRHDLEAHLAGPDFGVLLGALEVLGRRSQMEVMGSIEEAPDTLAFIRRIRNRGRNDDPPDPSEQSQ
jgi:quinol monooxygenase YgiN